MGARFGIESVHGKADSENIPGITGLSKNVGSGWRDWRTLLGTIFFLFPILVFFGRLLFWASSESTPAWTEIKEYPNGMNKGEKPLHHVAMAAKFPDLNKPLPYKYGRRKKEKKKIDTYGFPVHDCT